MTASPHDSHRGPRGAQSEPQATDWLTPRQQHIWRAYLAATARINENLDHRLRRFDLDLGEYEILVHLSEAPGRALRMSELADRVRQSRSRLTHTVSRMERKDILRRASCPSDGRGVIAELTKVGMELLERAAPVHVASVREALVDAVDPDDYEALGRAMTAVLEAAGGSPGWVTAPTRE